jgi:phage regulator Rha-like protein
MKEAHLARSELIEKRIFLIRGQRVMIDRDLADLYGVETKYLNRQVKRNRERFPPEFMFQLTSRERNELVTNWHRFVSLKHSTVLPYAFTEHGVAMLSSVLHGKRAIHINILIIKVFVKLREILATHKELAQRLQELEVKIEKHDEAISAIFEAIRQLMAPPLEKPKRPIGF